MLAALLVTQGVSADDGPAETIKALEAARQARLAEIQQERAAVLAQIASQGKLVDYLQTWAESATDRRLRARPLRGANSEYLERLNQRRETILTKITNFPTKAGGSIASGDALNRLLEVCGPTASSRVRARYGSAPLPLIGDGVSEEAKTIYSRLSNVPMPDVPLGDLHFRRGLIGPKLTGRLDGTVLATDWPLKLRESVYRSKCEAVEKARDKGLAELGSGKPISPETAARLMVAVEQLRNQIRADGIRNLRLYRDGKKYRPYEIAEHHLDVLMQGAARFINATKLEDVRIDVFKGGTLEQFLAYMHDNSLTFERSGPNEELAYGKVFQSMLAWYVDMQLLELAVSNEQDELADLQRRSRQLDDLDQAIRSNETTAVVAAVQSVAEAIGQPEIQTVVP